jgi:hypothetical protein
VAMSASTGGGVRPDVTETSDDDDGASPHVAYWQSATRRCRTAAEADSERSVAKCF